MPAVFVSSHANSATGCPPCASPTASCAAWWLGKVSSDRSALPAARARCRRNQVPTPQNADARLDRGHLLKCSFGLGIVFGLFGIEEAARALLSHFLGKQTVPGWISLMVVTSLIGSALLMSISVLGEYVGKIYEQVKGRPLYLVARTFNVEEPAREDAPARSSNHAQR